MINVLVDTIRRRPMFSSIVTVLGVIMVLTTYWMIKAILHSTNDGDSDAMAVVIAVSAVTASLFVLWRSVDPSTTTDSRESGDEEGSLDSVLNRIVSLEESVAGFGDVRDPMDESQRQKLVDSVSAQVREAAGKEVLDDIAKKIAAADNKDVTQKLIMDRFYGMRKRIENEIINLRSRSKANMFIGFGFAVFGMVVFFVVLAVGGHPSNDVTWGQALGVVRQLSLVVFVELLAYFFLRLYRDGADQIKYFQNELTNLECKWTAAILHVRLEKPESAGELLKVLAETERNHVLEAGQSTVEIEKAKLNPETAAQWLKAILPTAIKEANKTPNP